MTIERTASEIIIKVPASLNIEGLQRLLDFLAYKELTVTSKAKQEDVDELVSQIKKGRWAKNKKRLM